MTVLEMVFLPMDVSFLPAMMADLFIDCRGSPDHPVIYVQRPARSFCFSCDDAIDPATCCAKPTKRRIAGWPVPVLLFIAAML